MTKLAAALERAKRDLDDFAQTVSHDLREPLRGISINAAFLKREALSDTAQDRIDRIQILAQRTEKMVADLIFYSRLVNAETVRSNVDPSIVIDGIRNDLRDQLTDANGEIRIATTLPSISGDRSLVTLLFQQLIANGLTHNDADQEIIEVGFSASVKRKRTVIQNAFWVRDNRIGIREQDHESVFRTFHQLHPIDGVGTAVFFTFPLAQDAES